MHMFYLIQFISIQNLLSALHSTLSISSTPLLKSNNLITRAGEWFPGVTYTVFKTVFLFSISHYTDSFTDIWNLDLLNFWNGVPLTKLWLFTFYYIKFSFLYYGKLKKMFNTLSSAGFCWHFFCSLFQYTCTYLSYLNLLEFRESRVTYDFPKWWFLINCGKNIWMRSSLLTNFYEPNTVLLTAITMLHRSLQLVYFI